MDSRSHTALRTLWDIDPAHALIEFSVRHLEISTIKGRFTGVQGTIAIDESTHAEASVEVEIDVRTLSSGNEARDQHVLIAPESSTSKSIRQSLLRVIGSSCGKPGTPWYTET